MVIKTGYFYDNRPYHILCTIYVIKSLFELVLFVLHCCRQNFLLKAPAFPNYSKSYLCSQSTFSVPISLLRLKVFSHANN